MNIDIGGMLGGSLALTAVIFIGSIIFTIVIIWFVFRWTRKYSGRDSASQKLLQTGMPANARIVQMQQTSMMINNNPVANILLEVYPPNGMPPFQVWTQRTIPIFQLAQWQVGATVPVRFDPADQTKVAIAM